MELESQRFFADFYQDLYSLGEHEGENLEDELSSIVVPVIVDELKMALNRLKGGRTGADDGLVAEMLKTGHSDLIETIAAFFTDVLAGKLEPPEEWKVARLSVIFKKGDARDARNYRPISIIPVMAKLFSVVLYCRMRDTLETQFTEDNLALEGGADATMSTIFSK